MKKKKEKEEKEEEEVSEEEKEEPLTRQIQIQRLHFNILMSTEDPKENMDYLLSKAIEIMDTYDVA